MLDIATLMKCSDIRKKQLQRENQIDNQLQSCNSDKVKEYLFAYRKYNRMLSNTIYNSSILQTPAVLCNQLNSIEDHMNKIESSQDICKDLHVFIRELRNQV